MNEEALYCQSCGDEDCELLETRDGSILCRPCIDAVIEEIEEEKRVLEMNWVSEMVALGATFHETA